MKMTDGLSMKRSILIYLERSGGLQKLMEDCRLFNDPQRAEAIYRFNVSVHPSDVTEVDPELGDCLLHDPLRATTLFQSACFRVIKSRSLIGKLHTESQVNVVLNFTHLPPFPEYTLDLCRFPRVYRPVRPASMEGLVIAITRVTKYTQGARFLCTNDSCSSFGGFHHIRVHTPGATESAVVRSDFSCKSCSSPLTEDVKFRVLGDKQLVELVHVKALDVLTGRQQSSLRYQSVTLFLRDELCNSMRIGRRYRVIGIPAHVHNWPNITCSIEANHVQPLKPEYCHKVSASFQQLLKKTSSSCWRFSAIVAHCFGLHVAPAGMYNTLKLSLLLSLMQTRTDAEDMFHNLDLLVITTDTLIIDRLMTYSLSLACCGVKHQASAEMFASLSHDEHGAGTASIHAGSALLATEGICMLGELTRYKKDKLETLQSVLESRAVSVFIPGKKYGEDVDQQLSFPVHCSFWALTDSHQRSGRADCTLLGAAEMGHVPIQLADAFGLVVQCKDNVGEQALLAQTVHTLQQAIRAQKPRLPCWEFSTQEYQELVAHAQGLQVELSSAAEKIIHGYYMATRRIRTQNQGVNITVASIKLLISLAEAHCKLCLRTLVLEEDAVIAVLLCENSVTLKHGASALIIPPDAVFPCDLAGGNGLAKRDAMLDELHQNILRFIYTYAPGAGTYITEE